MAHAWVRAPHQRAQPRSDQVHFFTLYKTVIAHCLSLGVHDANTGVAWCSCIDACIVQTAVYFHIWQCKRGWKKECSVLQLRNVEDNHDKTVVDACGNPLPSCIVMERGEALDFWVARARPDRTQALSVCLLTFCSLLSVLATAYCLRGLS
jgi:hypothetical protein